MWQFGVEMNLEQARAKLDSISKATKHPQLLVSELCGIVRFLLDEVDRIKAPTFTTLTSSPEPNLGRRRLPEPLKESPPPFSPPDEPYDPDLLERKRRGNAGDAE